MLLLPNSEKRSKVNLQSKHFVTEPCAWLENETKSSLGAKKFSHLVPSLCFHRLRSNKFSWSIFSRRFCFNSTRSKFAQNSSNFSFGCCLKWTCRCEFSSLLKKIEWKTLESDCEIKRKTIYLSWEVLKLLVRLKKFSTLLKSYKVKRIFAFHAQLSRETYSDAPKF